MEVYHCPVRAGFCCAGDPTSLARDIICALSSGRSLEVHGQITDRFAETLVEAHMANPSPEEDKEAKFEVQIPETSFISNFTMLIEGELFIAEIKGELTQ